ncbi:MULTISPECIES: hypothetical protein [Sorangium]|uniref:hypothetical protein n=1 Tax=Sorangium TaxID=39643 RepID=UPI003D9C21DC
MANSRCPKCDSLYFEIATPRFGGNLPESVQIVQCRSCGAVVGAVSMHETASPQTSSISELDERVRRLSASLGEWSERTGDAIGTILEMVERIERKLDAK